MLRFVADSRGSRFRCTRREWLRIGGLAGLGLSLPTPRTAHARESEPTRSPVPGFGRAKSVIIVFTSGGQSQLETWDPKPDAPAEVRGAFAAIPTAVPGVAFGEHMPRLAALADRYTVIRTMSHEDLDHGSAVYLGLTGQYHRRRSSNPSPQPTDQPFLGSILKRVRPDSPFGYPAVNLNAPAIVAPNDIAPGQFGGFLGRDYEPMIVGDVTAGRIVIPELAPRDDIPQVRLAARQSLLEAIDGQRRRWEQNRQALERDVLYRQAFELLSNPRTRDAFDLAAEPESLRNRYGRNRSGQACLLARRLAEAGVPLITVVWNHHSRGQDHKPDDTDAYGWDTHNDIFDALKNRLLPRFDQSFSALLEDLDRRGLLDETLVIAMGEFGRAPLVALEANFIGTSPGRKHWASTYSIAVAGAGVARGKVLGRTDRLAAYPTNERYGPWDIAATIFSALGIDPARYYHDIAGRPFPIATGQPITGLYAS